MTRLFTTSNSVEKRKLLFHAVALAAAILLVVSASFGEFLHNHEADFDDHQDCPVHVLFYLLSTILVVIFTFQFITSATAHVAVDASTPTLQLLHPTHSSRAPPFSL